MKKIDEIYIYENHQHKLMHVFDGTGEFCSLDSKYAPTTKYVYNHLGHYPPEFTMSSILHKYPENVLYRTHYERVTYGFKDEAAIYQFYCYEPTFTEIIDKSVLSIPGLYKNERVY